MKAIRRYSAILAFLVLLPAAATAEPVVLYPKDLTLSLEPTIKIFAYSADSKDPIPVKVNGLARESLKGEAFQSGKTELYPGVNILNIGGKRVTVYHIPNVKMEQFVLPSEKEGGSKTFQAYRLHPALDDGCEGCHVIEEGKLKAKGQKEACYACHDNFEKVEEGQKKFVHTPVAAGECTGCHDPHFSSLPKLQKLEKGCYECHDAFPSEGTVHRPVADKECLPCHGTHIGPAPKQVVRTGNALCLGCHTNSHTQHRSAETKGKNTQVPPDIPRERQELSCKACHVPHQSSERRLFRMEQGQLCKTCHVL